MWVIGPGGVAIYPQSGRGVTTMALVAFFLYLKLTAYWYISQHILFRLSHPSLTSGLKMWILLVMAQFMEQILKVLSGGFLQFRGVKTEKGVKRICKRTDTLPALLLGLSPQEWARLLPFWLVTILSKSWYISPVCSIFVFPSTYDQLCPNRILWGFTMKVKSCLWLFPSAKSPALWLCLLVFF